MNNRSTQKFTPLPKGLSPFEKSVAKSFDIQGEFRTIAARAVQKAQQQNCALLEIDFPSFVGGDLSKSQFDDYDNLQELDANRDWCVQFAPLLQKQKQTIWNIFPDDKECELAKKEWMGQLYQKAALFTSIRAATCFVAGDNQYVKAWGTTIASTVNKITGGDGILGDSQALDKLSGNKDDESSTLYLFCQPGNGGPVEDWINIETMFKSSSDPKKSAVFCIVNGALDKVRDGYYPGIFFPALARTVSFYKKFEPTFILKPLSDKGAYGWLFRVYPEPWQVISQQPRQTEKGGETIVVIDEKVALVSDTRPSYAEAIQALLQAARES